MSNDHDEKFYFQQKNYFQRLKQIHQQEDLINSKHIRHALEYFLEDIKNDRKKTIEYFLNEQMIKDLLISLGLLLLSNDERICGNSAYIIGSTVEIERGLQEFISTFADQQTIQLIDIVETLSRLLIHTDADCVLNATGTLGTIVCSFEIGFLRDESQCGSKEGRQLILKHSCISQLILNTSILLNSSNSWIASNAALILARITVEEIGCQFILTHVKCRDILNHLLDALDTNDPSRSTNIAFAIARLIEEELGSKTLINLCGEKKFFAALLKMLEINDDKGLNKNACYALSCFCSNRYGFQLCVQSLTIFHQILLSIERILLSTEQETVWFALMCLTTIGKHDDAKEHLCYSKNLLDLIKNIRETWKDCKDIEEEAKLLWCMLHKRDKPSPPKIDNCQVNSVDVSWDRGENDDQIQYRLILDDTPITVTTNTNYTINDLRPNTTYQARIQYLTEHGDSVMSNPTVFRTDDQCIKQENEFRNYQPEIVVLVPPSVVNLHVARTALTAVRLAWEQPDLSVCNSFKGYQVYLNDNEYELTTDCGITITSLTANTSYQVDVCVIAMKGKGPMSSISVKTDSAGDTLPPPPTFYSIGRHELRVKWQAPEVISGRFSRYELRCNNRSIYSGTDQEYHVTMLKPDREYTIIVIVITNEGRFCSRPAKVRTLKDEFRYSSNESSTQNIRKLKRSDTFHSRKSSLNNEKQYNRELPIPHQNIQITSIRSFQIKPEMPSYSRTLPGLFRNSPVRPSRTLHRSKTDIIAQPLTTTIIIPTLNLKNSTPRTKSFRQSTEHSSTPSLPEIAYNNLQRII